MKTKKAIVSSETQEILTKMGEQIRLARLRRDLGVNYICEKATITRATLWKVEKGDPSVALGIYAGVLHAIDNMDQDLLNVAKDEIVAQTLEELNIDVRKRASKTNKK